MNERLTNFRLLNLPRIEAQLRARLPLSSFEGADRLNEALRYAVNSGGKRIRPLLTLLSSEICGIPAGDADALACAVEYLHLASVIFDDLPAMDDARMRRHLPALHLAFGEGVATLAALSLYARAFEILAGWPALVTEAARAVGAEGMAGGQAADLGGVHSARLRKTAPLICLALQGPAHAAGAGQDELAALAELGELLGEAYQILDDLLDALAAESETGKTAGQENPAFLDVELLKTMFLGPLEPYRERTAVLIFEFGTFSKKSFAELGAFLERLDAFLAALPAEFRYSVEIRNPEYLQPEYFECLRRHRVAHVYNAWSRMPELHRQIAIPESETADFVVSRALLRYGRPYEKAVEAFSPYTEIRDPNPEARQALRVLVNRSREERKLAFLFVNNRLEGNAPATIISLVE